MFKYFCIKYATCNKTHDCYLLLQELLDIDATKTGQILLLKVPHLIPKIVMKLNEEPKALFQFLQGRPSN